MVSNSPNQVLDISISAKLFSLVDFVKHLNTGVSDGVFPTASGDNSSNIAGYTFIREVFAVYDGTGIFERMDDGLCAQRTF